MRAFSTPGRRRRDVMAIVRQYMSGAAAPPMWTLVSVRALFGRQVAREWSRHIRHLAPAMTRQGPAAPVVFPAVQTLHDLQQAQ